jgi:dienelactone hydrolase
MRDLGRALVEHCYLVRAILLPGHGTIPDDLSEVDYRQWVEATADAVASFEGEAKRLVLVGFGLGATLAIDQALAEPPGSAPGARRAGSAGPGGQTETPLTWLRVAGPAGTAVGTAARLRPGTLRSPPRNAEVQRAA